MTDPTPGDPDLQRIVEAMVPAKGSHHDTYQLWHEAQAARAPEDRQSHICEDMNELCIEWVCGHVRAYARGEYVPFSWREALRDLFTRIGTRT